MPKPSKPSKSSPTGAAPSPTPSTPPPGAPETRGATPPPSPTSSPLSEEQWRAAISRGYRLAEEDAIFKLKMKAAHARAAQARKAGKTPSST